MAPCDSLVWEQLELIEACLCRALLMPGGLKKELLTPDPRAFCGQRRNNKPNTETSLFRSEVVCPRRARACQLQEMVKAGEVASPTFLKGLPVAGQR